MSDHILDENYYCTNCGITSEGERECCGSMMIAREEAEGFGLSEFEPAGGGAYDIHDDWN